MKTAPLGTRFFWPFALAAFSVFCLFACAPDDSAVDGNFTISTHVTDWRDEQIYQLLVDRFADGDLSNDQNVNPSGLGRYQGGDWQGVIDHIPYLQALGVTAIWVSPVVRNVDTDANFDGYHGYWAQDLTHTNPHFGDLATLRRMVQALHAVHMKVVLDIVTNHVGQLFYYDINENGVPDINVYGQGCPPSELNRNCGHDNQTPQITQVTEYDPDYDPKGVQAYTSLGFSGPAPVRWLYLPEIHRMPMMPPEFQNTDWYNKRGRIVNYDNDNTTHQPKEQVITGDFPGGLKDLKTSDPDVTAALLKAYTYWIGAADFDGFRIDTLKHVEHQFWQKFAPGVRDYAAKKNKKNFFMFGEAFDGDDQLVGSYTFNNEVDSAVYFPQKFRVFRDVLQTNQPTAHIESLWNDRPKNYETLPHDNGPTDANGKGISTQELLVNFFDNHDVPRFNYDLPCAGKDKCPALWNALSLLFLEQGIPCLYYGTEQDFAGGNDPSNRERLWDTGYPTSGRTFRWIRTLSDVRKKFRPLRHGVTQIRWSSPRTGMEKDAGIFAFERTDPEDGKRVLAVINVRDDKTSSTNASDVGGGAMLVGFAAGATLVNVLPDPNDPNALDPSMGGAPDKVVVGGDGKVTVTVGPRGQKLYVLAGDEGGIGALTAGGLGGM